MKLFFHKDENNAVTVKIQQGTVISDFTYTEMVKQLLEDNSIDDTDYDSLNTDEKESLQDMLNKISKIFETDGEEGANGQEIVEDEDEESDNYGDDDLPF